MAKRGTKIKLTAERTEALREMYQLLIDDFECNNDYRLLLLTHAREFEHRLKVMLVREQEHYTINLSEVEMTAFVGCWKDEPFAAGSWTGVIIKNIMDSIHKVFHDLKRVEYAR